MLSPSELDAAVVPLLVEKPSAQRERSVVGFPGTCCSAMNGTCLVRKSRLDGIDSVCASLETES